VPSQTNRAGGAAVGLLKWLPAHTESFGGFRLQIQNRIQIPNAVAGRTGTQAKVGDHKPNMLRMPAANIIE